jgi:hypothetical protein
MIKAHGMREGLIVEFNTLHSILIRTPGLPKGTGDIYGGTNDYSSYGVDWLSNSTHQGYVIAAIESALLALETHCGTYSANQQDDFQAIRDMMEVINAQMGPTWVPGLPDISELPGVVNAPGILTEYLSRGIFLKEDVSVGTDQWIVFPSPALADLHNLIPVKSYVQQSEYDTLALGMAKYGFFVSGADSPAEDVNTSGSAIGTDIRTDIGLEPSVDTIFAASSHEYYYTRALGAWTEGAYATGYDVDAQMEAHHAKDSLDSKHIWFKALQLANTGSYSFVDDQIAIVHEHYQPAQDLMEDYFIKLCEACKVSPNLTGSP